MKAYNSVSVSPAEQAVVQGFYDRFQEAPITIAFRQLYLEYTPNQKAVSLMPIITHPAKRVVLKDGEVARMHGVHPDSAKAHLNNVVLIMGTPYGIVVLHGREKDYRVSGKGIVTGSVPQLHTTTNFVGAAMRVFKRKGLKFNGDADLKAWIFSDSFREDLAVQAGLDRQKEVVSGMHGALLGDGLPKRIRQEHPVNKKPHDVKAAKPKAPNTRQPASSNAKPEEVLADVPM